MIYSCRSLCSHNCSYEQCCVVGYNVSATCYLLSVYYTVLYPSLFLLSNCSYAPGEDDRVGVYIAEHPLTPNTCYYETEIVDTGMEGSISIGLCTKRCPLDVHVGCATESVGLMADDGRYILVCICLFMISSLLSVSVIETLVVWSEFLATHPEVRVRFLALPDILRNSGSGTGSTQPREYN
jgi:hypothetical protein